MWCCGPLKLVALLHLIIMQESFALRCWTCNSETPTESFCNDPFDSSVIYRQNRRWSFVECSLPPQIGYSQSQYNQYNQYSSYNPYGGATRLKPVCQKAKHRIDGRVFVHRKCAWVSEYDPVDKCMSERTPAYIQREFCEYCEYDGCNGAAQYCPIVLLVAASTILLKFFSL